MIFMWTRLLNFLDKLIYFIFLMDEEVREATQFSIKTYHSCWKVNKTADVN